MRTILNIIGTFLGGLSFILSVFSASQGDYAQASYDLLISMYIAFLMKR